MVESYISAQFFNTSKAAKKINIPIDCEVSAGKNTYVYDAHTYHTKVPPEGIEQFIDYYTNEGDVVLDPFCGSGMTGIAVQRKHRKAILSDISPAAVFIANNLNSPINADEYIAAVDELMLKAKSLEHDLYSTSCRECGKEVPVLYTVWSYGAICNSCGKEFVIWDVARDERESVKESKILSEFDCPYCASYLKKRELKRTTLYPVALGYKCCIKSNKERMAALTQKDLDKLSRITYDSIPPSLWYPKNHFPDGVNTKQPIAAGIDSIEKAYFPRALHAYSFLWNEAINYPNEQIREKLIFTLTSLYQRITKFSEFRFWGGSSNTANYNVPHIINEQNVFKTFMRKAQTIYLYFNSEGLFEPDRFHAIIQSACHMNSIPDKSVDYIFTDPPFGGNINYSEMNFLWESWLQNYTDNIDEAIVNKVQGKDSKKYGELLSASLREMKRVLKDGGWLTIMFHNSSDRIWSELQKAITNTGFSIENALIFDKKHGTFKQFVSENAVGYDLILNCCVDKQEDAKVQLHNDEQIDNVKHFIDDRIGKLANSEYTVHFEHVKRADEIDFRKLYSEWLSNNVNGRMISLDFEHFRSIVKSELISRRGRV